MPIKFLSLFAIVTLVLSTQCFSQDNEPWRQDQLMEPAALAKMLNSPDSRKPTVLSIGFSGGIKGSKALGPASTKEGLENLKQEVSKLPKDTDIVIYCGCCPFTHCPTVRPAFRLLNEMGFKNHQLLNLSHNLKVDWIGKGYPVDQP